MRRTITPWALALLAALPFWGDADAHSPKRGPHERAGDPGLVDGSDVLEPGVLSEADVLEPGLLDVGDDDILEPGLLDVGDDDAPPPRPRRHARSRVRGRPWNPNLLEPGVLTEADILEPGLLGEDDILEPGLLDVGGRLEPPTPGARRQRPPGFIWDKDILEPGLLDVDDDPSSPAR